MKQTPFTHPFEPLRALVEAVDDESNFAAESIDWDELKAATKKAKAVLAWVDTDPPNDAQQSRIGQALGLGWVFLNAPHHQQVYLLHVSGLYVRVSMMAFEMEENAVSAVASALNTAIKAGIIGEGLVEITRHGTESEASFSAKVFRAQPFREAAQAVAEGRLVLFDWVHNPGVPAHGNKPAVSATWRLFHKEDSSLLALVNDAGEGLVWLTAGQDDPATHVIYPDPAVTRQNVERLIIAGGPVPAPQDTLDNPLDRIAEGTYSGQELERWTGEMLGIDDQDDVVSIAACIVRDADKSLTGGRADV